MNDPSSNHSSAPLLAPPQPGPLGHPQSAQPQLGDSAAPSTRLLSLPWERPGQREDGPGQEAGREKEKASLSHFPQLQARDGKAGMSGQ